MIDGRKETYVIIGDPTPLARARHTRKGGGRVYDPQKQAKLLFGLNLKEQHNNKPYLSGPLFLYLRLFMPLPESWSFNKKQRMKGRPHMVVPDKSNMEKFVEDSAKGILFKDDCIIYHSDVMKLYDDGNGSRTEITIVERLDE